MSGRPFARVECGDPVAARPSNLLESSGVVMEWKCG